MKCVVTGGAGFIGSHLVDKLISMGADVTVIDNLVTGDADNLNPQAQFIKEDLNRANLRDHFDKHDYVFHLAALPRIVPSFESPYEHHVANIDSTLKIIEASSISGIKKIIYSGSSSVYGNPSEVPTTEQAMINPLNPYSLQKYASEQYGLLIGQHSGLPFVSLRYMNPYGSRSFNEKNPFNAYSSVVGIFENLYMNDLPLKITGDGSQARDFIHIDDVVSANIAVALSEVEYDIFNVGTGKAVSIKDVANMFNTEMEYIPARPGEANITLADINRISDETSWKPVGELEQYINNIIKKKKELLT